VGDGTFRLTKSSDAADKIARRIIILGEDEVAAGTATVKTFATGEQIKIEKSELKELLKS
jgi:histidyl-tRNA synthetase